MIQYLDETFHAGSARSLDQQIHPRMNLGQDGIGHFLDGGATLGRFTEFVAGEATHLANRKQFLDTQLARRTTGLAMKFGGIVTEFTHIAEREPGGTLK